MFNCRRNNYWISKQAIFALSLLVLTTYKHLKSQVYSETFSSTLAASGWTNVNLTVPWSSGTFIGISNTWKVADSESGRPANTCGGANLGNPSLYIGATALASGAAYLSNAATNRRIMSPNINTTGYTNMTLSFNYIGNGEANDDKAYLQYSTDGGTTWINATGAPTSSNPALPAGANLNNLKSQICGTGQGRWTNITWDLPVVCENITNLKIAFVWQNDTDANATDPSFAVDDVTITTSAPLPIQLLSFTGKNYGAENVLTWQTASEVNNDFFTIEHSSDAVNFFELGIVDGAGNSNQTLNYTYIDKHPGIGINYYRLKQTDFNGQYKYSNTIALENNTENHFDIINSYNNPEQNILELTFSCSEECILNIELFDLNGKKIYSVVANTEGSSTKILIPSHLLSKGIYLIKAYNGKEIITKKINL
jgi:hypothetical protein